MLIHRKNIRIKSLTILATYRKKKIRYDIVQP